MSDSTINLLIAVLGFLGNGLILLQLKKRQDVAAEERKLVNDKELAETRKKNAIEVEELRHKFQMEENTKFRTDIDDLKKGIGLMNIKLNEHAVKMEQATTAFQESSKKTDEYLTKFEEYKKWNFGRIQQLDHKIMELDANFGKVIVKGS
jgi:hypothetical protein